MNNYNTNHEYKQVNSKLIFIDSEYQRQLDNNRVKRIVANFNPDLVNPIKINLRQGKYYCFDGQHTLGSLKTRNGGQDLMVECKVYSGKSKKWEAEMFAKQNGISRQVETAAKLKALYLSGDIDVVEFYNVTNGAGVRMDFSKGAADNKIIACSTAYKIFKSSSQSDYIETINILKEAFQGQKESFSNQLLLGVSQFHKTYKGEYKRQLLIRQLERVSPVEIIRDASLYKNDGSHRYSNQILNIYNKGTRSSRLQSRH